MSDSNIFLKNFVIGSADDDLSSDKPKTSSIDTSEDTEDTEDEDEDEDDDEKTLEIFSSKKKSNKDVLMDIIKTLKKENGKESIREFKNETKISESIDHALYLLQLSFKQYQKIMTSKIMKFVSLVIGNIGDVKTGQFMDSESMIKTFPYGFLVNESDRRNKITLPIMKQYESILKTLNSESGEVEQKDGKPLEIGSSIRQQNITVDKCGEFHIKNVKAAIKENIKAAKFNIPYHSMSLYEPFINMLDKLTASIHHDDEVECLDENHMHVMKGFIYDKKKTDNINDMITHLNIHFDEYSEKEKKKILRIFDVYKKIENHQSALIKSYSRDFRVKPVKENNYLIGTGIKTILRDDSSPIKFKTKKIKLISDETIENLRNDFSNRLSIFLESLYNTHVLSEAREIVQTNPFILGDLLLKDSIKSAIKTSYSSVSSTANIKLNGIGEMITNTSKIVVISFAELVASKLRYTQNISKIGISSRYAPVAVLTALKTEYNTHLLKFSRLRRDNKGELFLDTKSRRRSNCIQSNNELDDDTLMGITMYGKHDINAKIDMIERKKRKMSHMWNNSSMF